MADALYMLDSNICIYILGDAQSPAASRLALCAPGQAVVSAIACAEISLGVAAAGPKAMKQLDRFFQLVPVVPFDRPAAQTYHRLPFRRGRFDRLIAAHSLALDLTLVTNNVADFADVADLTIENWTQ